MTVYLNYDIEMLCNLTALYKYTDRFPTIFFNLVDVCVTEKYFEICRILTGWIALLRFLAQGNLEQNVIQFLVLFYIMDKPGHY